MFQPGEMFRSNIHYAIALVLGESQGTVSYAIIDSGQTCLLKNTVYHIATSVFMDYYHDNGKPVTADDLRN
jgi:hypothetical protein